VKSTKVVKRTESKDVESDRLEGLNIVQEIKNMTLENMKAKEQKNRNCKIARIKKKISERYVLLLTYVYVIYYAFCKSIL